MPASWAGPQLMLCNLDRIAINPTGLTGREVVVPLSSLPLESARPMHGRVGARHASAPWQLTLRGHGTDLNLTGHWLTLAWIGHLATWPDPSTLSDGDRRERTS